MVRVLTDEIVFPDVENASPEGVLAVGGDLSLDRLLLAYRSGIFPWFSEDEPIIWWSPDPRFVLFPEQLKISKSTRQILKKDSFQVTVNTNFEAVIENCAKIKRKGQNDTWITNDMILAYTKLHRLGYATSVEVWQDRQLVGGLYGVDLGNGIFCGESMFSKVNNASKIGFVTFVQQSNYTLFDCQVHTDYLESLGAESIDRTVFLSYL